MDPSTLIALLLGLFLGAVGVVAVRWIHERRRVTIAGPTTVAPTVDGAPVAGSPPIGTALEAPAEDLLSIATSLEGLARKCAHPRDLLANERFERGVDLLLRDHRTPEELLDYMGSGRIVAACMALEALARRTEANDVAPLTDRVPSEYTQIDLRTAYFALRALAKRAAEPVVGRVLARVNKEWVSPLRLGILREFVTLRLRDGEISRFDQELDRLVYDPRAPVPTVVERLKDILPERLHGEFRAWVESHKRDAVQPDDDEPPTADAADDSPAFHAAFLGALGRIWAGNEGGTSVRMSDRLAAVVNQVADLVRADRPRSVALVGEAGVGKTSAVRAVADQLRDDGWTIFEAGTVDLMAGQTYVGQLEDRIRMLVSALRRPKVLWMVPDFQELLWAGAHKDNPSGVIDRILDHMLNGEIKLLAEMTPASYERLLQAKPRLRMALVATRVPSAGDAETLELGRWWAASREREAGAPLLSEDGVREAMQLARQYVTQRAGPGNLLDLLTLTYQRLVTAGSARPSSITHTDLLITLSQLTGLPISMLDERERLDVDALRSFFRRRVIGQAEAVDCLTERVAMIKAGVTDPARPAGVFLFVGPTGTGKTEIAKALAQYLFGSAERMIRLDMSELQTPESLDRILGEAGQWGESTALVNAIRRQPFSVVLLDEFEKAHPSVWDLFLQMFDDGRLTDRRGNVADCRHTVVIMTSNLGATLPYGAVIGFTPGDPRFAATSVERAVAETFRREFINRIDRVVVFRPLGRAEMREILHKELDDVFRRRGLRNRSWAVEWEASAVEFLLEKGFTPDLGARPLKRAIERYLLGPLATTIANHRVPAGDQFLFVSSDGDRLDVVFVDPDATDDDADERSADREADGEMEVRRLVADARGSREEVDFLEDRFADLADRVGASEWHDRKARALADMRQPGFWDSPTRFAVLGTAEYMDRVEAGFETANSLLRRLSRSGLGGRDHYPRDVVQRLAQQLYLLEIACSVLASGNPRDAYVMVRASRDSGTDHAQADAFAERIGGAYREWAKKRRMRLDVIDEVHGSGSTPYAVLMAVSGFGAYSILEAESGLHVMETPQDAKSFNRVRARVIVAPQEEVPVANPREVRARAMRAIDARSDETAQVIVRRYREDPSPLVRDAVRQWRTGRIDRVFGGDFDLFG